MDPYPGRAGSQPSASAHSSSAAMHRKRESTPRSDLARSASERPVRPPRVLRRSTDTCKFAPGPARARMPTDFDDFFNLPPPVLPPELAAYCRPQGLYDHRPESGSDDASSLFLDAPEDDDRWTSRLQLQPPPHRARSVGSQDDPDRPTVGDCVVIDLAECSEPGHPPPQAGLEPASRLARQAFESLRREHPDSEGLLLMDVERCSRFPFVTYVVLKTDRAELRRLLSRLEDAVGAQERQHVHHIAGYEEVAAVERPEDDDAARRGPSGVGFIVSAFRVFPGEDREKLERHWLVWTGANLVYHRLPRRLGLARITLHKKVCPERGVNYVMVCECATLLDNVTEACVFVDHLRARCCGHTALYRVVDVF